MFLKAALLIIIGIVCLITAVIALIFGVVAFANNKQNKYVWLTTFLGSLIGMIICIFMFVSKAASTIQNISNNTLVQFDHFNDSLSNDDTHQANSSSSQIKLLKGYLPKNVSGSEPEQFYNYLGFNDYHRYPLRYPFSIHCMNLKDNCELYNESNVTRFDENDNGEVFTGVSNIKRIAFDKSYLLMEQVTTSSRNDKAINHYVLYNLDTDKREETTSLSELLLLAKQKGYSGSDSLITMEEYGRLF